MRFQINFMIGLAYSPLDQFEIVPLITVRMPIVGSFVLALTNLGLYSVIVVILIMGLHVIANNGNRLVPSHWSVAIESALASVHSIVRGQIGERQEIYVPVVYALFWFVLIANLNGNVPYGFTITTRAVTAMGLSVIVFIAATALMLRLHGLSSFAYFVPGGTPLGLVPLLVLIELISYFARAVSLGVRLFANMVAGHALLKILATFLGQLFTSGIFTAVLTLIPFVVFIGLIGLEFAVSLIQAYVFTVLTASYLKDSIELH